MGESSCIPNSLYSYFRFVKNNLITLTNEPLKNNITYKLILINVTTHLLQHSSQLLLNSNYMNMLVVVVEISTLELRVNITKRLKSISKQRARTKIF